MSCTFQISRHLFLNVRIHSPEVCWAAAHIFKRVLKHSYHFHCSQEKGLMAAWNESPPPEQEAC